MKNDIIVVYKSFADKILSDKFLCILGDCLINSKPCPFSINLLKEKDKKYLREKRKYCKYKGKIYVNPPQTTYKEVCSNREGKWLFCRAIRSIIISRIKGWNYKAKINPSVKELKAISSFSSFWSNPRIIEKYRNELIKKERKEGEKVFSDYKKWKEKIEKYELIDNILVIRKIKKEDLEEFKNFVKENKSKIREVHLTKYLEQEIVSEIISFMNNLVGKVNWKFYTTGEWIYDRLGDLKRFFQIYYIGKTYRFISDLRNYGLNGMSPEDARVMVKRKYKYKISIKLIAILMKIAVCEGVRVAIEWLRYFFYKKLKEKIMNYYYWTGKSPPPIKI
jgi:hypothetical protein